MWNDHYCSIIREKNTRNSFPHTSMALVGTLNDLVSIITIYDSQNQVLQVSSLFCFLEGACIATEQPNFVLVLFLFYGSL